MISLDDMGYAPVHADALAALGDDDLTPARVSAEHRDRYEIWTPSGERGAVLTGRLRFATDDRTELPTVGDFVGVRVPGATGDVVIDAVLPRRTALVRLNPGGRKTEGQTLAANVDVVMVVAALNEDFNVRRIERTLALIWESGARPVVVLNKADLSEDVLAARDAVVGSAPGVDVHAVSAVDGTGLDELDPYLSPAATVALIGSSGVGKSTLSNRLRGDEAMATGAIREGDGRGRHTTSHRQLLRLPGGALLLDTPGLREVGLWDSGSGLEETFTDVDALSASCRFRDCSHTSEPGCAVLEAIDAGELDEGRLKSYRKLERELHRLAIRQDKAAQAQAARKWKKLSVTYRQRTKARKKP